MRGGLAVAACVQSSGHVGLSSPRSKTTAARRGWRAWAWRLALVLSLLYCMLAAARQGIAAWYFGRGTFEGVKRSAAWEPQNPHYLNALARAIQVSFTADDRTQILRLYEKVTRLAPAESEYWVELGSAYELDGKLEDAKRAYGRALQSFPNSPEINWRVANFELRAGRLPEALRALRKTVTTEPGMREAAFDLAFRAAVPGDEILAQVIPPEKEILFEYLSFLLDTKRLDDAAHAWAQILATSIAFEPAEAFRYLDDLIVNRRVDELAAAWTALAERNPARIHLSAGDENLVTNGSFEQEILNGGLDWRVVAREGAHVELDRQTFFDGAASLAIHFDGRQNLDYSHVYQYVLVQANTEYQFHAYRRGMGLTSDRGPRIEIVDAYSRGNLSLSTEGILGTTGWSQSSLRFRTGPDTRLLMIVVARSPSRKFDNQIAGTFWMDQVSLTTANLR
jgi:hypothetical protein